LSIELTARHHSSAKTADGVDLCTVAPHVGGRSALLGYSSALIAAWSALVAVYLAVFSIVAMVKFAPFRILLDTPLRLLPPGRDHRRTSRPTKIMVTLKRLSGNPTRSRNL